MVRGALEDLYDPAGRDGLLLSSVHPGQARVAERARKRFPVVVVGGAGALSPGAYEAATGVVCGDYQGFVSALRGGLDEALSLPNVYVPGESRAVEIDGAFPWQESGKHIGEDGRAMVFCSRGCRHRCAFCQTAWATIYREHPAPGEIETLPAGRYNYVSNALGEVSFFSRLPPTAGASHTLTSAVRLANPGRLVRVGVEGVSERLRRAVGKPLRNQDLVDWTLALNGRGVQVRWFMIAGLPGENAEDWLELYDCVKAYTTSHERGTLQISFTAYVPEPATPIRGLLFRDEYWDSYKRFADWYFGKARIAHLSIFRPQGPANRAVKAAAQMHPGNTRVLYPHRDKLAGALRAYCRHADLGTPAHSATASSLRA